MERTECMTKTTTTTKTTNKDSHWKILKGRSPLRTPFFQNRYGPQLPAKSPPQFSELLLVPDFSVAEAAAFLPIIFLGIVSWTALLSGRIRISRGLAAPRAKETKYRENHQDRSHFLYILVRIGGIRTISRRRSSDPTHATTTSGTATRHAAFSTFHPAIADATWTGPERATGPATAPERANGRASQH